VRIAIDTAPDGTFIFGRTVVQELALNFIGDGAMRTDPYAFAANGDLAGYPATIIVNSEFDSLRASGEAFARALSDAGVEADVSYEPGSVHGHLDQPTMPQGRRTLDRMIAWLSTR
jgi:acetyl esterase/lipase